VKGRGVFLGDLPCPYRKGALPHLAPILEVPSAELCRRTTKFDVVTLTYMNTARTGLGFRGQPRLHPRRRGFSAPQYLGFTCIYAMRTYFTAERTNMMWY